MNTFKFYMLLLLISCLVSSAHGIGVFPNLNQFYASSAGWAWDDYNHGFNHTYMDVADVNGDSVSELVMYTSNSGDSDVLVYSHDLETLHCELSVPGFLHDAYLGQLDQDPALEMVFASDEMIIQFDGLTCAQEADYSFSQSVSDVSVDDTDANGVADVIYSLNGDLYLMAMDDVDNPIIRAGFGSYHLGFVDIGRQNYKDITVFDSGLYILNGQNLTTINYFDDMVHDYYGIGDINGDGDYEVAYRPNGSGTKVSVFDVFTSTWLYEIETNGYYSVLGMSDLDGDQKDDVILRTMDAYNNQGQLVFELADPFDYIHNFKSVDFDQSGTADLFLFGRGDTFAAPNQVFRIDASTGQTLWQSPLTNGPYHLSSTIEQVANKSQLGVSFYEVNTGYEVGGSVLMETRKGTLSSALFVHDDAPWGSGDDVEVGRPTANDDPVLCYSGTDINNVFVRCLDILTGQENWFRDHPNGYARYMEIMDIDGDEINELVMVSGNGKVSVYQLQNGFLKWHSNSEIGHVYGGFNQLFLIAGEIWVFHNQTLQKINPANGATIDSMVTNLTAISYQNGQLFGVIENVGLGRLNPVDLTMDELLYPTIEEVSYLSVSADGKVGFIAHDVSSSSVTYNPEKVAALVSFNNDFLPHDLGEIELYDSLFPNEFVLYLSSGNGVRKLDLKILNELIFEDGFE